MIEALVVSAALLGGLLVRLLGLPPMIGFLVAGFLLPIHPTFSNLDFSQVTDLGVTLLLFTIGLKLDIKSLVKVRIWGVTSAHMAISIGVYVAIFSALKLLGWQLLTELNLMQLATIGFALSFSSTVFAVKVLEDRGEMLSLHGSLAIGVLVMQDLIAVLYLTAMGDKTPLITAPLLLLLIPLRSTFDRFLNWCGHGELLTLAGFAFALGSFSLFEWVQLKGQLGALVMGAIIAGTSKASELSKTLLGFKDLFLVGFFLSIGQAGLPSDDAWIMAGILLAILAIKPTMYFLLFTRCRLRSHTAYASALTLNNYSEFGLIVAAYAAQSKMLPEQWSVIIALAISLSYLASSLIIGKQNDWYESLKHRLNQFQRSSLEQQPMIDIGKATCAVMGMGRVGTGAYDYFDKNSSEQLIGFDENQTKTQLHQQHGRNVITSDVSNPEFWDRLPLAQLDHILLALSNHTETLQVAELIMKNGYRGTLAATAIYPDEVAQLKKRGLIAFNLYAEAGAGFAEHVHHQLTTYSEPAIENIKQTHG